MRVCYSADAPLLTWGGDDGSDQEAHIRPEGGTDAEAPRGGNSRQRKPGSVGRPPPRRQLHGRRTRLRPALDPRHLAPPRLATASESNQPLPLQLLGDFELGETVLVEMSVDGVSDKLAESIRRDGDQARRRNHAVSSCRQWCCAWVAPPRSGAYCFVQPQHQPCPKSPLKERGTADALPRL